MGSEGLLGPLNARDWPVVSALHERYVNVLIDLPLYAIGDLDGVVEAGL